MGAEFRPPAWTGRFLSETSSTPLEASGYTITPPGSPRPSQGCCGEGMAITFPIMFPKRQVSAPCRLEGWLQGRGICTGQLPTQNRKITEGHMLIPNPVPPLQLFLKFFKIQNFNNQLLVNIQSSLCTVFFHALIVMG